MHWFRALYVASGFIFLMSPGALSFGDALAEQSSEFLALPSYDFLRQENSSKQGQTELKVGDTIELRLANGALPTSGALVVEPGSPPGSDVDQGWLLEFKNSIFTLTLLKPGQLTVPSLPLKDTSGKIVGRTNPFSVEVLSVLPPAEGKNGTPSEPVPLRPPVSLPFPVSVLLIFGLLGLLVSLLVVAIVIYLLHKWSKSKKIIPVPILPQAPIESEDEVALRKLLEIERLQLPKKGSFKQYCFGLSEIMKAYLGERFRFDALESTTYELLVLLERKTSVSREIVEIVEDLFGELDRVKFSDRVPGIDETKIWMENARQLVFSTRRSKQTENGRGGA